MADDKIKEIKITIPVPDELFSLFLPIGALEHVRAARKEVLLALRAVLDSRIEALEKKEQKQAATKRKIKIE
jgi:hypothetical protein